MQVVALLALFLGAGALFVGVQGYRAEATRHLRELAGPRPATIAESEALGVRTPRRFVGPSVFLAVGIAGVATGIALMMTSGRA